MTLKITGGGGSPINPPEAIKKEVNTDNSASMPSGDGDGSYIKLPANSAADLEKYDAAGVLDWAVDQTDINASATQWGGFFWLDTVDNAIWVAPYNPGAVVYLAKIDLATGTGTPVGAGAATANLWGSAFASYYFTRVAMGNGNFTIRDGDQEIVLSSADGSVVTPFTQISQNGKTLDPTLGYETEDGAIYTGVFTRVDGLLQLDIQRGGMFRTDISTPIDSPFAAAGRFLNWGGYIATQATATASGGRFFNRVDIDDWLTRLCDFYGLPE